MFAYICRVRQFALRSQYLQRTAAARQTGSVDMPSYPAPLVQLRPVATHTPAAEDEGTVRECPICFEEITQNQEWLLLPCKHGVCAACYQKLIQDQHQVTTCPLCRMPLCAKADQCFEPRAKPWDITHVVSKEQSAYARHHTSTSKLVPAPHVAANGSAVSSTVKSA